MGTSRHAILFLSGAGLPAWIWDGVRERLDGAHETSVAARPAGGSAGLREYAAAAIDSVRAERFAIVAHSAGGVVGAEVSRLAPARVVGLLAVSAVVPKPGGSFLTALPAPNRWVLGAAMRMAGTRPPESAIRRTLAHGLDERTVDRLVAGFAPESPGFHRDRIGGRPSYGRRGYVLTTRDRELSPSWQRRFAARLGASCRHELPTGHLPMLEVPDALAEVVSSFLASRPDASD
ncbi:alpha/beta fold hydrolase [Microbacterium sp. No. 7]|uniref:alpha/beta fold hydrolase n=1 Tax=Microbacterium sp. No. 7 TaxID=1714373 RepID=UPI0006D0182F|nr:alpha/beta hydrolase [Microbacterium sp. No. 7]ALJ20472.1 hypothetical protein AOA12_11365 [Microbacterium sp. No. 7]